MDWGWFMAHAEDMRNIFLIIACGVIIAVALCAMVRYRNAKRGIE